GAAVVPEGKELSLIFVERTGKAFQLGITDQGQLRSQPKPISIVGLQNCTSLAWFDGKMWAADSGALIPFEPNPAGAWKKGSPQIECEGEVFIHSDGKRLVLSDMASGTVRVFESHQGNIAQTASYQELKSPSHIAIAGDRIVVYEAGLQRLVKLEFVATPSKPPTPTIVTSAKSYLDSNLVHKDEDFQN